MENKKIIIIFLQSIFFLSLFISQPITFANERPFGPVVNQIPPNPSKEVMQRLAGQKFYFMVNGSVYESKGVQKKAKQILKSKRHKQGRGTKTVWYFLPVKSFDQKFLVVYKIYSFDQWSGLDPGKTKLIQLLLLNLERDEETVIFDSEKEGIKQFPEYFSDDGLFGYVPKESLFQRCAINWSEDGQRVNFNFIDQNYSYDRNNEKLEKRQGIEEIELSLIDKCDDGVFSFLDPFSGESRYDCFLDREKRFTFSKEVKEGWFPVWYIKGVDNQTGENFKLTVIKKGIYAE